MKVNFKHSGQYYIMLWHEYNEGHHLIVSKTQQGIEKVFDRAVIKEGLGVVAKEYYLVEMVSPSDKMIELSKEAFEHNARVNFKSYVIGLIYRCDKKHTFKKCTNLDTGSPEYDSDPNKDDDHYSCKNCFRGYLPESMTFEELYQMWKDKYLSQPSEVKVFRHDKYKTHVLDLGSARKISEEEVKDTWVVDGDFGHHNHGIVINPVSYDEDINARNFATEIRFYDNVGFFFKKLETLPVDPFNEKVQVLIKKEKQYQKAREKKREVERKVEENQAYRNFVEILSSKKE